MIKKHPVLLIKGTANYQPWVRIEKSPGCVIVVPHDPAVMKTTFQTLNIDENVLIQLCCLILTKSHSLSFLQCPCMELHILHSQ